MLFREGRGCRDKGGAVKKQQCSLGAGPGSPSRDAHSNIFELFYRNKIPSKWKMLAFFISKKVSLIMPRNLSFFKET